MTVTARLTLVEAFKKTLNDGIKPRMCKHGFNQKMSYYLDFETSHLWMQHFPASPYFSPSPEKQWQDPLPPYIPIWWNFEWQWQSLQQRLPDVLHGKSSCALTPKLHLLFYFWVFVFVFSLVCPQAIARRYSRHSIRTYRETLGKQRRQGPEQIKFMLTHANNTFL